MSDIKDEVVEETVDEVIVEDTQVEAEEVIETPDAPLTAARTVSAIQASLAEMSKEGLDEIFEAAEKAKAKAKVEDDEEEEDDEDDEDEGEVENTKVKAKKESKKSKTEVVDDEKDTEGKSKAKKKKVKTDDGSEGDTVESKKAGKFKEDVEALVKDEDTLSEGFKEKAATIFEAALTSKVNAETAKLEERYASDLTGEVEAIKEDLVDKVDGYLTYVVENWMKDNEVAIEHSLKSEITESFIQSLGQLFAEHHINVPDDAGDILDSLSEEAKDAKAQLNDATEKAIELSEKVKAYERQDIIREACKGLAATEAAKLTELTEAIEADDNDGFVTKVATIKESYLNKDTPAETLTEVDGVSEDSQEKQVVSDQMQKYLDAIKRT
ncbi:MAG TPA: hypothetical protein EYQ21_04510 [Flavobacteriales bacterium]|nr:hypothetical protein [Flavobacteriales bacterium]